LEKATLIDESGDAGEDEMMVFLIYFLYFSMQ
jgi:hypothetical protein